MSETLQKSRMPYSTTEECKEALQFIEDVTSNPDQVQHRVLAEILSQNAGVEYLTRHGLHPNSDRQTFKKLMPVINYEDIQSEINRIANGDKSSILCSTPISEFLTSSGTSGGERKLMPTTEDELGRRSWLNHLPKPVMSQFDSDVDKGKGKGMFFYFIKSESKTAGGLVARPVLTSFYKSKHFKDRPYDPYTDYTSPNEAILCLDTYQSMYAQLLCGLCLRNEVLRVGSTFASVLIRVIRFLEEHWSLLCNDIRTGSPNPDILTDQSVKDAVMKILKPDTELAAFIEQECSTSLWQGIITRLWPNTKYMDVTVTGSMSQYIPTIDFYSNGLPLVCKMYGASECYFGVNLNPFCKPSEVSYTLIPTMGYFEFLPVNDKSVPESLNNKEERVLVDLADVQIGQEYELVVTTYAGLYRYRVGDVLRVAGFKNKAPQFNFIGRKNVVLSIDSDKTDEVELQNAVKNAVNHLFPFDTTLAEYTSYADLSTNLGHYVLFWELKVNGSMPIPSNVFEDCCLTVEESLNSVYRQGRASDNSIGALEIRIVKNGTFDKLMDYAITMGASINQYKTPRGVKFEPIINLLNSGVVSTYFSKKLPKWVPGINSGMVRI